MIEEESEYLPTPEQLKQLDLPDIMEYLKLYFKTIEGGLVNRGHDPVLTSYSFKLIDKYLNNELTILKQELRSELLLRLRYNLDYLIDLIDPEIKNLFLRLGRKWINSVFRELQLRLDNEAGRPTIKVR